MSVFSDKIIFWFKENRRELPWRQTSDPYHIWLSEVILQQTRVAQGMAYYHRFLEKFPTIKDLAEAGQDSVLEIWQGLGYYSRARNLHAAAKWVLEAHGGVFPGTYSEIIKMKGVGAYTAAAISSFAFHEDQVVVDGNVLRFFTRFFGISKDIRNAKTQFEVYQLVKNFLPLGDSWNYNQAIMEMGALVCLPKNPVCEQCPVSENCVARREGTQTEIPLKSKASPRRIRYLNYLLLEFEDSFYFEKRGPKDIWEGLYQPILIESESLFTSFFQLESHVHLKMDIKKVQNFPVSKHILSHQELMIGFWKVDLKTKPEAGEGQWVSVSDLDSLPKPIIFSKILGLKKEQP